MPARPHTAPSAGTFIIVQQRGHDRILFEVNAGKMLSIRVEPEGDEAAYTVADEDDAVHADLPMDTKSMC
ncbi:hypothetical protein IV454_26195 [Massilia antarctica]|uniref:Uncharacterized protein n=1 Tax=Massilia antarctica TaxID=2765360 RepID=A0AA48WC13_9BURK|nr:hypothetical protein [Massilia antarctica]QPI48943.1 hypothetical protein IV454_26195 [Massilia antarctica]